MKKIILLIIVLLIGLGIFLYLQNASIKKAPFVPGKLLPVENIPEDRSGI